MTNLETSIKRLWSAPDALVIGAGEALLRLVAAAIVLAAVLYHLFVALVHGAALLAAPNLVAPVRAIDLPIAPFALLQYSSLINALHISLIYVRLL